jgi:hypothetical protein
MQEIAEGDSSAACKRQLGCPSSTTASIDITSEVLDTFRPIRTITGSFSVEAWSTFAATVPTWLPKRSTGCSATSITHRKCGGGHVRTG